MASNSKKFEFGLKHGHFRTPSFGFGYGRDDVWQMNVFILIAWGKVEEPKEGQSLYKNSIHLSWDWLPTIERWHDLIIDPNVYDSAAWTGRRHYMTRIRWNRKFQVRLARKERKEN